MPSYVVRYSKEEPAQYFEWSTVVDAPTSRLMSRDEMRKHLLWKYGHQDEAEPDERMDRADKNGSSCMWSDDLFWDEDIFTQQGMAKRDALKFDSDNYWFDPEPTPFDHGEDNAS